MHSIAILSGLIFPVAANPMRYVQIAENIQEFRAAILAWQQDPASNSPPIGLLTSVIENLENNRGWFRLSKRSLRKSIVINILSNKLVELQTVNSVSELPSDFDDKLLEIIIELESLTYQPTLRGAMFRLVVGC